MNTKVQIINELNREETLREAGELIKKGGIVAFPTETVYGLGADALNPEAVKKIFIAKGRPQDNPLIVHVAHKDLSAYVEEVPQIAQKLIDEFWPGPLTIILKKKPIIPDETSAHLDTIGLRMPANEIALELIKNANTPIAAPSANLSGKPSPTEVSHCIKDLTGRVDYILGGENSDVGLESTIVDCTSIPPCILRPGGISIEQLQRFDPSIYLDPHLLEPVNDLFKPKAPGMKYRHYAPNAPLKIIDLGERTPIYMNELTKEMQEEGKRVGIIATDESKALYEADVILSLGSKSNLNSIAKNLYDALRQMDEQSVDLIFVEAFNEIGLGKAIMNRLKKAASYDIVKDELSI